MQLATESPIERDPASSKEWLESALGSLDEEDAESSSGRFENQLMLLKNALSTGGTGNYASSLLSALEYLHTNAAKQLEKDELSRVLWGAKTGRKILEEYGSLSSFFEESYKGLEASYKKDSFGACHFNGDETYRRNILIRKYLGELALVRPFTENEYPDAAEWVRKIFVLVGQNMREYLLGKGQTHAHEKGTSQQIYLTSLTGFGRFSGRAHGLGIELREFCTNDEEERKVRELLIAQFNSDPTGINYVKVSSRKQIASLLGLTLNEDDKYVPPSSE